MKREKSANLRGAPSTPHKFVYAVCPPRHVNVTQTSRSAARSHLCPGWASVAWSVLATPNPAYKKNARRSALKCNADVLLAGILLIINKAIEHRIVQTTQ